MEYADFTIRLSGSDGERFAARVVDSPAGGMAEPEMVLYRAAVEPLLERLEAPGSHGHLTDRELVEMGELLGEMLLPPRVRELLRRSLVGLWSLAPAERRGLRLLLKLEDPWLESLPWEYLYMWEYRHLRKRGGKKAKLLDGFLSRDPRVSIVRRVSAAAGTPAGSPGALEADKLNVVFALADPGDLGQEIGRSAAAREILRTVAEVGEWARGRRALDLDARLIGRLDQAALAHPGRARDGEEAAAPLDRSALPELLADEGRGAAHSRALLRLQDRERPLTPVHVVDFRGHGGLLSAGLVDEEGRLRLRPAPSEPRPEREAWTNADRRGLRRRRARRYRLLGRLAGLSRQEKAARRQPGASGSARDEPGADAEGLAERKGMLVLEDEDGGHRIVWAREAGESLTSSGVAVLLLDTCRAGHPETGPLFAWSGLGESLVEAGVPVVVTMQRGISPAAAAAFSTAFYAALLTGASADRAVALGRGSVADLRDENNAAGVEEWLAHRDWGVPVLFSGGAETLCFARAASEGPSAGDARPGSPADGFGRTWSARRLEPRGGKRAVFEVEDERGRPVKPGTKVRLTHTVEGGARPYSQKAKADRDGKVTVLLPPKLIETPFRTKVEPR